MPKSISQKLAQAKYDQKSYDQILIKVRKGKREEYKDAAEKLGLGQMELFRTAVEEYIKNHGGEVVVPAARQETETISAEERRLIQAFANLPDNVKPTIKKLVEQLAQSSS